MSWTVTYCECIWEYEQVLNRLTTHVFTYVRLKIYIKHYAVCSSRVFCRIFAFFCCCCSGRGQRKIRLTAYVFFWFSRAVITVWQLPMTCVEIVWGLKKNYTSGYLLLQVIPVKVCVCVWDNLVALFEEGEKNIINMLMEHGNETPLLALAIQ